MVLDKSLPPLALLSSLAHRVLLVLIVSSHAHLRLRLPLLLLEVDVVQFRAHLRLLWSAEVPVHLLGVLLDVVHGTAVPVIVHLLVIFGFFLLHSILHEHIVIGLPRLVVLPLTHVLRRDVYVQDVLLIRCARSLWPELVLGHTINGQLRRSLAKLLRHEPLHLLRRQRAKTLWQQALGRAHSQ